MSCISLSFCVLRMGEALCLHFFSLLFLERAEFSCIFPFSVVNDRIRFAVLDVFVVIVVVRFFFPSKMPIRALCYFHSICNVVIVHY